MNKDAKVEYQAPAVRRLGSLGEMTQLKDKHPYPTSDGYTYNGIIINS